MLQVSPEVKEFLNTGVKNLISFTKLVYLKLSVIIVNFNVKYFLEQCLCSVIAACRNIEAEILVIDNHSSDGSRAYLSGRFDKVLFTWCDQNAGFSKANNLGLQQASGEYILFLNPDTIIPEDCLEKCLHFFPIHPGLGALGVRMIDGSGQYLPESKRAYPSPLTSLYKLTGLAALFPHSATFARYYLGQLDPTQNHEVDVLAGAFMMVKKEVLNQTGGFDERFFMYGEDVDLSYRIRQAGFKNIFFAETTIVHFKGESTNRESPDHTRLFYGAMHLFITKHYSRGKALWYTLFIRLAGATKMLSLVYSNFFYKTRIAKIYQTCLVISSEEEFKRIRSIILGNYPPSIHIEKINTADTDDAGIVENLSKLSIVAKDSEATMLVFCDDIVPVKKIIYLLEHLPGISFRFHLTGSRSVVGSDDKTLSGVAFPGE